MAGGGHRPQLITKDLVQGWVKKIVSEQKPTPVEARNNTGNSGVAARWRAVKSRIVLAIMSVVDALHSNIGLSSV